MGKTPWFLQNVTFGWGTGMDWDLTALFSPLLLFNRFVFFILSSSSSLPLFKEEDCDGGGEGHFLHFHILVFTQFLFFWLLSILIFLFIPFLLFLLLLLLFSLMLPFKGLRQRLVLFWHFFRFCLLEDLWCGGGAWSFLALLAHILSLPTRDLAGHYRCCLTVSWCQLFAWTRLWPTMLQDQQ